PRASVTNRSPTSARRCCAPYASVTATCRGRPSSSASVATRCIAAADGSVFRHSAPAPSPSHWHGTCFSPDPAPFGRLLLLQLDPVMSRARGTRAVVRLAAGVRLDGSSEKKGGVVLVCPNGNV